MEQLNYLWIALAVTLLPLGGALIAGLLGYKIGRLATHRLTISLIGISFLLSCYLFYKITLLEMNPIEGDFYRWASAGLLNFKVGFLLDSLSVTMAMVVLFVSLLVHIYTIDYMADDPGYQRFFSYMSLFTFSMLILVFANNFLLLFFGWEGVGLVSYLLIGFWFKREAAIFGSLKAFIVNRVGDMGFILGIAMILTYFGSLNYQEVFQGIPHVVTQTFVLLGYPVSIITLICVFLFIGAMGKSAQMPLHVWLPESMEGPTPISALIHAATMVTAGIYMVARLSPLFEFSESTLNFILFIGGSTALFMGLVALTQYDIKRVIAYSTLSQLGYMVVALGASAYDAAIFHLLTHAFFKALLFLAAGSVIIALHHEQDMRKMGGLARLMPITYLTFMIGALALSAIPPFSGFYSKDIIIEAVKTSHLAYAPYAYLCVLLGAFITPLYIFRAVLMTFHLRSKPLVVEGHNPRESSWIICGSLLALAIPSIFAGAVGIHPLIFAQHTWFKASVFVLPEHNVVSHLANDYAGPTLMALTAGSTLAFWLALAGIFAAWLFMVVAPTWTESLKNRFFFIYFILRKKYGFDDFNQKILVKGAQEAGYLFYHVGDLKLLDGIVVNGSGHFIQRFAKVTRLFQTGYIYHYAWVMVITLFIFLAWYAW